MKIQNKLSIAILTSLGLGATSFSAQAIQEGDMFMRLTATQVAPNDDSTGFTNNTTLFPSADDSTTLGATFVYMMNNNLGLEVLASLPFEHDVTVAGLGKVGTTKQLPPTISVQYHFSPEAKFRPFVAAGLNYTIFFNDTLDASVGVGTDLELDNSFGLAAQVGFDYDIDEKWFVSADIRYISIETTASKAILGTSDIDVNPTVISIGMGYKF